MTYAQLYDLVLRYERLLSAVKGFCSRHEGDQHIPDLYKIADQAANCTELPGFRERNEGADENAMSQGAQVRNNMRMRENQNAVNAERMSREGSSEARDRPPRPRNRRNFFAGITEATPRPASEYVVSGRTQTLVSQAVHGNPASPTTIRARDALQRCPEAIPVLNEALGWWAREQAAALTGTVNGEGREVLNRMAQLHQIWEGFRAAQANHAPNDGFVEVAPTEAPTFRAVPDAQIERNNERIQQLRDHLQEHQRLLRGNDRGNAEQPSPNLGQHDPAHLGNGAGSAAPVPTETSGTPPAGPGPALPGTAGADCFVSGNWTVRYVSNGGGEETSW
jgi:hypothetical protein